MLCCSVFYCILHCIFVCCVYLFFLKEEEKKKKKKKIVKIVVGVFFFLVMGEGYEILELKFRKISAPPKRQ